jgi:hypothetical protein
VVHGIEPPFENGLPDGRQGLGGEAIVLLAFQLVGQEVALREGAGALLQPAILLGQAKVQRALPLLAGLNGETVPCRRIP